jgi:hypothetical protein
MSLAVEAQGQLEPASPTNPAAGQSVCGQKGMVGDASYWVGCIDFDQVKVFAPGVPWPKGTVTQVLISARTGDAVQVQLGDTVLWGDLVLKPDGTRGAILQLPGMSYQSVRVRIYGELK